MSLCEDFRNFIFTKPLPADFTMEDSDVIE